MLQSFLEARFVYLCLVPSLELSLALFLSHSLLRSRPLWTPSMIITCTLSFHVLLTFYHMHTIFTC